MRIIALIRVRNEQWVLRASLSAALRVVDAAVILDHASDDDTPRIIDQATREHPGRIIRLEQRELDWTDAPMLQRMLMAGREAGGTHFCIFDADELLTGNIIPRWRAWVEALNPGDAIWLPWLALWRSLDCYRDDASIWSGNFKLQTFRDGPDVRFEALPDGYDYHCRPTGVSEPAVKPLTTMDQGGLMHLQFADWPRLQAKHAWYKMSETIRWPGRSTQAQLNRKYGRALDETDLRVSAVDRSWWEAHASLRPLIDMNDTPWHAAQCERWLDEHGPDKFEGLDLWGVADGRLCREANRA